MFDSNQGQKFATKSENLFGFSQWNLQESIDSRRTILYDKLKYLPAIHLDSLNFVNENLERMDSGILVKLVTLILVLFLFVCLFICLFVFSVNKSSIRESSLIYTILCICSYKSWKEWILGFALIKFLSLILHQGGYLVERWVRGCAAQIGCFFGLSGFAMAPFLFENWFWYRSRFCKMHNFRWIFPLVYL